MDQVIIEFLSKVVIMEIVPKTKKKGFALEQLTGSQRGNLCTSEK